MRAPIIRAKKKKILKFLSVETVLPKLKEIEIQSKPLRYDAFSYFVVRMFVSAHGFVLQMADYVLDIFIK